MSIRTLLVSLGLALCLAAAAIGAVASGVVSIQGVPQASAHDSAPQGPFSGPAHQVEERVVNMADPGARRYLKFALVLHFEVDSPEYEQATPEQRARMDVEFRDQLGLDRFIIDDALTTILTTKTVADVTTQAGKEELREEIRSTLNEAMQGRHRISRVLFTEFVVQ